jgi:FkbM family methyltransferase
LRGVQLSVIGNAEKVSFIESCKISGVVLLLAPSSYLGGIYSSLIAAKLTEQFPGIKLIAVDDVLYKQKAEVSGFAEVNPVEWLKGNGRYSGMPVVNCAYSLPTWLFFDELAGSAQYVRFDLPELLYALDIPLVYEIGAVTRSLTLAHAPAFAKLRTRFADDLSRKTLDAVLHMRMDGDRRALLDVLCSGEQEYFSLYSCAEHPIRLRLNEHYVDIGAYDGDTVRKFMTAARYEYEVIHAFEPDPVNFSAMKGILGERDPRIKLLHQAVSDRDGFLSFSAKGTMGSRAEINGDVQVPCVRLDNVLDKVTLLKMDVEGHEANVLRGAAQLIKKCRPRMAITCYHHALDILEIVSTIDEISPGATLRLRHYSMYFYDTILYVEWPDADE